MALIQFGRHGLGTDEKERSDSHTIIDVVSANFLLRALEEDRAKTMSLVSL